MLIGKIIYKIYSKLISLTKEPVSIRERLGQNLVMDSSSILKEDSDFYFNPIHPRGQEASIFIGKKSLVTAKFMFEHKLGKISIGDNVYMGGVTLICKTGITIGNNVTMAWGIMLYDHDAHSTDWKERMNDNQRCYEDYKNHHGNLNVTKDWSVVNSKEIIIKDNAWIGFDALILKGVTVGEGAVIAAKSVVTKDVPPYTLVAGNPAKIVKQLKSYQA